MAGRVRQREFWEWERPGKNGLWPDSGRDLRHQAESIPAHRCKGCDLWIGAAQVSKTGEWPGSIMAWGTERVWADPTEETVDSGLTFGRKGMAIHGGWTPGSAGCIDLTGNMTSFAKTFRSLGRDLKLYVDYGKSPP